MGILLFFAFISGLITILAPCIWPILPIVLSASSTGGHKKPLGVTLGIIFTFALLTLTISYIVRLFPFDPSILRYISVAVISFLGLSLIIPALSQKVEGYVSRLSGKLNIGTNPKSGFWGGLITGMALGIVWTPCAGPILATIAALSATQSVNGGVILITLAYVVGVGIPLFIFATFGRKLFAKSKILSPHLGRIQQIFGLIMLLTAILILFNFDKTIQLKLLNYFPSYSKFLNQFEGNPLVKNQLDSLKNKESATIDETSLFNVNIPAPEFDGITKWLNTSDALTIEKLKGKVVLVDFWTYTCINCIRTLPHVTRWYDKYNKEGFVVLGVHTPEFEFEKNTNNVLYAIKQYNIHYPVAQDNDFSTWNAYSNQYWPAEYLIDANGIVRRVHFGEGEYDKMEKAIQLLLKENGKKVSSSLETMADESPSQRLSPETYLGAKRMQYYYPNGSLGTGKSDFKLAEPPINNFSLGGTWEINEEEAIASNKSALNYNFFADKVFLVLRPGSKNSKLRIFLDGKPVSTTDAGKDVKNGEVILTSDKLYNLIDLKNGPENHLLRIEFEGIEIKAFAFTFG